MASERADELYRALIERRYPKELCSEIAYKYLNTDYTATRMLGYLYRMTEPPAVEGQGAAYKEKRIRTCPGGDQ